MHRTLGLKEITAIGTFGVEEPRDPQAYLSKSLHRDRDRVQHDLHIMRFGAGVSVYMAALRPVRLFRVIGGWEKSFATVTVVCYNNMGF